MTDLASLMADEPVHLENSARSVYGAIARNDFRAELRPHLSELEAREQALLARVEQLEAALRDAMCPGHLTGELDWPCIDEDCEWARATLEGRTQE